MRRRHFLLTLASPLAASLVSSASAQEPRAQEPRAQEPRAQEPPVLDATLDSMSSGRVRLGRERGRRLVVLFYENRNCVEDNDRLKRSLSSWVEEHHLGDRILTYGVANLRALPRHIPQAFARVQIQPLVERWGSEILLDWRGRLCQPPWSMHNSRSNVVILDRRGRMVWHTTGPVRGERSTAFFETLRYYLQR